MPKQYESTNEPPATLTRSDAATLIGCSKHVVRRMEERGLLRAVVGHDGVHRFHSLAVLGAAKDRRARMLGDGELAARAFELLDEGRSPRVIARRLRAPAAVVDELVRWWRGWQTGELVVPVQCRRRLKRVIKCDDAFDIVAGVGSLVEENDRLRRANETAVGRISNLICLLVEYAAENHDIVSALREQLTSEEAEILDLALAARAAMKP